MSVVGRRPNAKALFLVFAGLTPFLGLFVAALWVFFGSVQTEGLWDTLFLQTEKARSAYLTSIAILVGGSFLYLVLVIALFLAVAALRGEFTKEKGAEDEDAAGDEAEEAKPFRHPRARSVRDAAWIRVVEFFLEGVVLPAYGATGVWVELSKPSEERIGWVLGVFVLLTVSGVLGIVANLFWKDD